MILTVTLDASVDKCYLVDKFKLNERQKALSCSCNIKGKGIIVSKVAAMIGEDVVATGYLGGYAGKIILKELKKWRIDTEFIEVSAENSLNVNIKNNYNMAITEVSDPGGYITVEDQEELMRKYCDLLNCSEVVIISGDIPKGCNSALYNYMIQIAREKGKKVLLNLKGVLLQQFSKSKATMIHVNYNELSSLAGQSVNTKDEAIKIAKSMCKSGMEFITFLDESNKLLFVCNDGVYESLSEMNKQSDTIINMDALFAGFAVGLSKHKAVIDTMRLSIAALLAMEQSTNKGFFSREDIARRLENVEVRKIES